METFPPIVEKRSSFPTGYRSKHSSQASGSGDVAVGPSVNAWGGAATAAPVTAPSSNPTVDDVAVNRSRAVATRIRAGYRESDTLGTMLERVRTQFLHRSPDAESCTRLPLVFPPTVPSCLRPAQSQMAGFSRGIRLLQTLQRDQPTTTATATAVTTQTSPPLPPSSTSSPPNLPPLWTVAEESCSIPRIGRSPLSGCGDSDDAGLLSEGHSTLIGRRASLASTLMPRRASVATLPAAADSRTEGLLSATGGGGVYCSIPSSPSAGDVVDRQAPMLRYFSLPRSVDGGDIATRTALRLGLGPVLSSFPEGTLTPLYELTSSAARYAQLLELEACCRQHVWATEAWGRQAVCEMMMVHYVTFVLRPEIDELLATERTARAALRFDEEKARYELCEASVIAAAVRDGARAVRARELKLSRLARAEAAQSRAAAPLSVRGDEKIATASSVSPATPVAKEGSEDPRALLERYVAMKHGREIRAAAGLPSTPPSPSANAATAVINGPVPTSFQHAAAEVKGWPDSRGPQLPSASPADRPEATSARRCSGLVLPPIFGGGRQLPRRNTVGIANYIALLEEDERGRTRVAEAEAADRAELLSLARTQWNAVRAWQHKKLHLERLLYWRAAREQREQAELAVVSDVAGEAALRSCAAAERVASAVDALLLKEEEARYALLNDERDCLQEREVEYTQLQVRSAAAAMVTAHREACEESYGQLLGVQQGVGTECETLLRAAIAQDYEHWLAQVAIPRTEVLQVLYLFTRAGGSAAALRLLQKAFRRCASGQLGWRQTHRHVGQDIRQQRVKRQVQRGRDQLAEMRRAMAEEQAIIDAAERAGHAAKLHALQDDEFQRRLASTVQEGWTFDTLRRQFVDEMRTNVTEPELRRCTTTEQTGRLDTEVGEELRRETLLHWFKSLADLIARKCELVASEAAHRRALVHEEDALRAHLYAACVDGAEEVRIAATERRARNAEVLAAFTERALREHTNACEVLRRSLAEMAVHQRFALLSEAAVDASWAATLAAREAMERAQLRQSFTAATAAAVEAEQAAEMARNSLSERFRALSDAEAAARDAIRSEEAAAWRQTAQEDFFKTPSGQMVHSYQQQRRAVGVIGSAYVRTRDHELGRTATRHYLHDAFEIRRELAELHAVRARQREHVCKAKGHLAAQIAEERADAQQACQFLMDLVVTRTEPRLRRELMETEAFLRSLIFRNFFPGANDDRIDYGTMPTVEQRVDREVLQRRETRERDTIMDEWLAVFQHFFAREWVTSTGDASARTIQRVWRSHCRRQHARSACSDTLGALMDEERAARLQVECEALKTFALTIDLPCIAATAGLVSVQQLLPRGLDDMCNAVGRALIQQAEWDRRAELLWKMRYALCDDALCAEEARARGRLVRAVHLPGLEHAQLKSQEGLERDLLATERRLFLLRVLVKEEAAVRRLGVQAEYTRELKEVRAAAAQQNTEANDECGEL